MMNQVETLKFPFKSESDMKDYRLIRLSNGIKVLLIRRANETSAETDNEVLAAANLTVRIGSFDDPPKALGLAHFLEHMVHMGSARYPEESEYNDFLTANGGRRNAMTSSQFSTYFFNVSEKVFPEALDRLEQLIETPLLLKNSMQREREAVDSEYKMQISNDAVRCQSILKSLIYDSHPASQFEFGNLRTLKEEISDEDLHAELLKLHTKYVAKKMSLAVQSRRSLDELQELVVKSFSNIKSGDDEQPRIPQKLEEIFKPEFSSKIYFIKPKSAKKAFMMTWAIPSIHEHYKCSPIDYLSMIFSNDGEGGISSYLKEKQLSTGIGIFMEENAFVSNTDFALVRMVVELTDLGSDNIEKILEAVFSYLLMIKETPTNEHRRYYTDLMEKTQNDFNFQKESSSMDNVFNYATNMVTYDDVDILRGASVYQEFDQEVIAKTIEALNERKFCLIFFTDKHSTFEKKEKYFATEYDEKDFPVAYQKLWDERKLNPEFFLVKPNPFKTTNFKIFVNQQESSKYPVNIRENEHVKVWHKLDNKFNKPHVSFKVLMISPICTESKNCYTQMKIFESVLDFYLTKKLSQAASAGYRVITAADRSGILITFHGYNDKLVMLIDMVASYLRNCIFEADEVTFNTLKEDLKESYSEKLMKSNGLNNEIAERILLFNNFTLNDVYSEIDKVSFEDLREFSSKFFQKMKMEILSQGNITKNQTVNVVKILQSNLSSEPLIDLPEMKQRCYELPQGTSIARVKSFLPNDDNTIIKNFYQIGTDTLRKRSFSKLIEAMLNPKAYDFLRSKEQLGYAVACQLEKKGGTIGLSVIVLSQEHKHPFTEVQQKMGIFMNEVAKKTVEELTDDDFEKFKDSRIKKLLAEELDLATEVANNWYEVKEQDYVFDRLELAANVTKSLTKLELQEFFKTFTQPENMRMLSVQVIGNKGSDEVQTENIKHKDLTVKLVTEKVTEDENVITDIDELRNQMFLHPVVKFEV